jgi:hypothetical protein
VSSLPLFSGEHEEVVLVVNIDQHTLPEFCLYYNGLEDPQPGQRVMPTYVSQTNKPKIKFTLHL